MWVTAWFRAENRKMAKIKQVVIIVGLKTRAQISKEGKRRVEHKMHSESIINYYFWNLGICFNCTVHNIWKNPGLGEIWSCVRNYKCTPNKHSIKYRCTHKSVNSSWLLTIVHAFSALNFQSLEGDLSYCGRINSRCNNAKMIHPKSNGFIATENIRELRQAAIKACFDQ